MTDSTPDSRGRALEHAISWGTGNQAYDQVVKAAECFEGFLLGAPRPHRSLDELFGGERPWDPAEWQLPEWRSDLLRSVVEAVWGRMNWVTRLQTLGRLTDPEDGRAAAKGVRGLTAHFMTQQGVETSDGQAGIFELPFVDVEHEYSCDENEVLSKSVTHLFEFFEGLADTMAASLDAKLNSRLQSLIDAAGVSEFGLVEGDVRAEFFHRGGIRAKEYTEDATWRWNLLMRICCAGAIFVPWNDRQ